MIQSVLESIDLDPSAGVSPHTLFSPTLGYDYIYGSKDEMTLIGFTGQRQKSISVRHGDIRSVTEFDELQDDERSIKMQARGVGTRMYNTVEACLGTGEGDNIKAYAFTLNPDKIVDRRRDSDGTRRGRLAQAARQFGRIVETRYIGVEFTVDMIHASFGNPANVDAVLYGQSATMERQQAQIGGVEQPAGVPPEFMIIRNPHIVMRKIGEYQG